MHGHAKPQLNFGHGDVFSTVLKHLSARCQVDAVANNRMISLKESEARIVTLLIGVVGALSNWITHS
eukprot:1080639-Amorphochlora_amoeboformis.AAC.1